jgi:hypothetical protein
MLDIPHRNANATASPHRISGVMNTRVCWRFDAAADRFPTTGISHAIPVPSKIAR